MTLDEIKFWTMVAFQLLNALGSSGLWLYVRFGDRNKQIDRRFEHMARAHDQRAHDDRGGRRRDGRGRGLRPYPATPINRNPGALKDRDSPQRSGETK